MAFLFCVSRDGTSSDINYRLFVNDNTIDYDNVFTWTQNGVTKTYKKAVGIYYYHASYNTYYMGVIACNNNLNQCWKWEEYTPGSGTREYISEYANYGYSYGFGSDKPVDFGDAIPFFNNYDDASNWSLDLPYNASNWIGGKPLTPLYNWQAVPSIVGKSAVSLDLSVILDINNGEAVTTSDASKFDLNNDSNVITLVNNVINQNE